jgi:hypothetical protein
MKLRGNRTQIDKLTFHWDHQASRSSHTQRGMDTDYDKKLSLDKYFDLLDEIKPHMPELRHTRVFEKPFTLV